MMQTTSAKQSILLVEEAYQIAQEPTFDFMSDEYEELFLASEATAFQGPEWLGTFYNTLVPALDVEPLIITLRDPENGTLQLVLPLVRQQAMGAKLVQPADLGVSDYNAIIAKPETLWRLEKDQPTVDAIKETLKPFDALLFRKQREDGFCISRLFDQAILSPNENSAYDLSVETDFEEWLNNDVSPQFKKEVLRKHRSFERNVGALTFEYARTDAELDEAFAFLRRMRRERFADDLFCKDAFFNFYRTFAGAAIPTGRAYVYVCKVEGRIAAVEFGPADRQVCCLVHGGFDMEFGKYSPGKLLLVQLMENRMANGQNKFDFTIGDHGYKKRFQTQKSVLKNAVLANGPLGQLVSVTYRNGGGIKKFLNKLNPNVS